MDIDLAGAMIVHSAAATDMERLAARELARYLFRGSGRPGPVMTDEAVPGDSPNGMVLLDVAASLDSATGGLAGLAPVARIVNANGVADVDEKLVQGTFEPAIDSRAALGGS